MHRHILQAPVGQELILTPDKHYYQASSAEQTMADGTVVPVGCATVWAVHVPFLRSKGWHPHPDHHETRIAPPAHHTPNGGFPQPVTVGASTVTVTVASEPVTQTIAPAKQG